MQIEAMGEAESPGVRGDAARGFRERVSGHWFVPGIVAFLTLWVGACGSARSVADLFDTDVDPPPDSLLAYTVYLIGDAGDPFTPDGDIEPALQMLEAHLAEADSNAAVVFLGDNIYPSGLPPVSAPNREDAEARILAQIEVVRDFRGRIVFVPGNHDWGGDGLGGSLATLLRQEEFVQSTLAREYDTFLPDNGFPGPAIVELADSLVLIPLNTQWWLEPNKIYGDTGLYQLELEGEFLIELDDVLRRYEGWHKIVVGHHPLYSNGEHGGYFASEDDIFVLPPLSRRFLGTPQDLSNRKYRILREGMLAVFRQHPNLVYAAGHDHNLQYFPQGEQHYIVSGSGSKSGYVAYDHGEAFAAESQGFARLKYYRNGSGWLEFWTPGGDSNMGEMVWSARIIDPDRTEAEAAIARASANREVGTPVESVADVSTPEHPEGGLSPEEVSSGQVQEGEGTRNKPDVSGRGEDSPLPESDSDTDAPVSAEGNEEATDQEPAQAQSDEGIGGTVVEEAGPQPRGVIDPTLPPSAGTDGTRGGDVGDSDDGDQGDRDGEGDTDDSEEDGGDASDEGDGDQASTPYASRAEGIPEQVSYVFCSDGAVTVSAGERYDVSAFQEFVLGAGYRDIWTAPIEVPVIDLDCTAGGLTPLQRGGGLQTISLRLQGGDGDQYVLRSIDKDPTQSIPEYLRETVAEDVVQDQISAINPYSAFIVPELARAANVLHTSPTLVYIPDSPRLGIYREDFAGMLALLEVRPDEDQSDEARFGFSGNLVGTPKMFEEVEEDNDETIDVRAWIRARLLDMLIGDWDRHKDQWRWAEFQGPYGVIYEPVPRDRDFAFFRFSGLPRVFARWLGDPKMRRFSNFGPNYGDILGLNYNGAAMDRRITGPVGREVWLEIADSLQQVITDDVIEEAVRGWPEPVFEEIGEYTIESLKVRRDKLPRIADRYYDLLAHIVDLFGSDKHERFEIRQIDEDRIEVIAYKTKKEGDVVRELYRRTFDGEETGEIRIYGFGGNDTYVVTGEGAAGINVRIIGGEGEDQLIDQVAEGADNVTFYDTETGTTVAQDQNDLHLRLIDTPLINAYNSERFEYNIVSPVVSFGYNGTSGLFLGGGVKVVSPEFRKYPYGHMHVLEANFTLRERAYNVLYTGHVVEIYKDWDANLLAGARAVNDFRSFYGLGNETDEDARDFYNARLQYIRAEPTLERVIAPFTSINIGPRLEYANIEPPDGVSEENPNPLVTRFTPDDFIDKYYAGLHTALTINGLDTLVATESGMRWANELTLNTGIRNTSDRFARLATDLRYFYTFTFQPRTTLAFRVGAAHTFGDFEFFQANALGGESSLRGYPTTRFAGRTSFFQNVEARTKLFDFNAYLTRGELGALAFFDNGRVWYDDEDSGKWHQGYGAGLWVIPFYRVAIVSTLGFSEEGPEFDLSLGFLF